MTFLNTSGSVLSSCILPVGSNWHTTSLLAGQPAGSGDWAEVSSPVTGTPLQKVQLLDNSELTALTAPSSEPLHIDHDELAAFCERLHTQLQALWPELNEALLLETGFTRHDCDELLAGSLQFVQEFPALLLHEKPVLVASYQHADQARQISLTRCAWGNVAIVLPQNAFLLVALTGLLNALAAGNRVILRAPLQSARSAALLAQALLAAQEPWNAISLVNTRALDFLQTLYAAPEPVLVHYMGGSNRAAQLLGQSFEAGQPAIIDGSGNTWTWIDADFPLDDAVDILLAGSTRYNGQTCTSINGALVHPQIYEAVQEQLQQRWAELSYGNPLTEEVRVGPLFDEKQALGCQQQLHESGGTLLCGGKRTGNLLQPTLISEPSCQSTLVNEGIFGPALWIAPGTAEEFCELWQSNRYPLCAAVLSPGADASWWASRLRNLSRLILNGDPSLEHIHEPWGGYPSSSANTVSRWIEKYQRVVQVDAPA
jgi:acyl-CoA reductase-like NAD-dependent aldehyde dehydrogenase